MIKCNGGPGGLEFAIKSQGLPIFEGFPLCTLYTVHLLLDKPLAGHASPTPNGRKPVSNITILQAWGVSDLARVILVGVLLFAQQCQPLLLKTHNHFDKHLAAFFHSAKSEPYFNPWEVEKGPRSSTVQTKVVVGVVLVVEEVVSSCFGSFSCPNLLSAGDLIIQDLRIDGFKNDWVQKAFSATLPWTHSALKPCQENC